MNYILIIDADLENCKRIKYNLQKADTDAYYTHSIMKALSHDTGDKNYFSSTIKKTTVCRK